MTSILAMEYTIHSVFASIYMYKDMREELKANKSFLWHFANSFCFRDIFSFTYAAAEQNTNYKHTHPVQPGRSSFSPNRALPHKPHIRIRLYVIGWWQWGHMLSVIDSNRKWKVLLSEFWVFISLKIWIFVSANRFSLNTHIEIQIQFLCFISVY